MDHFFSLNSGALFIADNGAFYIADDSNPCFRNRRPFDISAEIFNITLVII